jgi:hypothetical protein
MYLTSYGKRYFGGMNKAESWMYHLTQGDIVYNVLIEPLATLVMGTLPPPSCTHCLLPDAPRTSESIMRLYYDFLRAV